jgi:hypothetical protein
VCASTDRPARQRAYRPSSSGAISPIVSGVPVHGFVIALGLS